MSNCICRKFKARKIGVYYKGLRKSMTVCENCGRTPPVFMPIDFSLTENRIKMWKQCPGVVEKYLAKPSKEEWERLYLGHWDSQGDDKPRPNHILGGPNPNKMFIGVDPAAPNGDHSALTIINTKAFTKKIHDKARLKRRGKEYIYLDDLFQILGLEE